MVDFSEVQHRQCQCCPRTEPLALNWILGPAQTFVVTSHPLYAALTPEASSKIANWLQRVVIETL